MILDKNLQLFVGCRIDSKLREGLAHAKPGDRRYFEDADSEFLRICTVGDNEQWIGKIVKPGLNTQEFEDLQRNVLSILKRIAPDVRKASSTVKIYAIDTAAIAAAEKAEAEGESVDEKKTEGEPYIANL